MPKARVGKPAPPFELTCVAAADAAPRSAALGDYAGRWLVLVFYPRDFSFVCPTELTSFSAQLADFHSRDCELLGISVDPIELHRQWLASPASEGGVGGLRFPLASDPDGAAARAYGVWVEEKQVATRGLFVIDPDGVLQYSVVHNLSVGRRPDVVLRVLDALRTGGLCAANWTAADGTIDPEQALQPGRILGHYRIRKRLGAGTFGTVFAAWDIRLERMVALKVLKRNLLESREAVLTEARAAAALNDPHVCTIYAVEEEDGLPLIAMEYLEGRPLSQAIEEGLESRLGLSLCSQVASGLAGAHRQDVVHGDLKPANVMISIDGVAKILDFGLSGGRSATRGDAAERPRPSLSPARDVPSDAEEIGATIVHEVLTPDATTDLHSSIRGTPAYMSPEQAGGLPATTASDVYSFGLILFEILTGRPARRKAPVIELLVEIQSHDLAPALAIQLDEPYRPLLLGMLAREAVRRPSMADVAHRLAAIAAG